MHYFPIIITLLVSLGLAKPVPEAWLAEAQPNDLVNFTEIAEHLDIRDNHLEKRNQRLWAVFSTLTFSTTGAPGGGESEIVQNSGFSIINPAGNSVYHLTGCDGSSICNNGGQRTAIRGFPCMGGQFIYGCETGRIGNPTKCAIWKDDASSPANLVDKRAGGQQYYNNFLSAGYKGRCVVSFTVPGSCGKSAPHPGADPACRPLDQSGVPDP